MAKEKVVGYKTEAEMCAAFIGMVPEDWVVYPETGGFDILLVRKEDGFQIGIEAKLKLNAKVVSQAAESMCPYLAAANGPDCRAVLVPANTGSDLCEVCRLLGIEVVRIRLPSQIEEERQWNRGKINWFYPNLPEIDRVWCGVSNGTKWFEFCPAQRVSLPDYIPDTGAGNSAPVQLTHWKIKAIKIAVTIEKRGYVTRHDFKHHQINISRWTQYGLAAWIVAKERGKYIAGKNMPDFKTQHPLNYEQIAADYDDWKMPDDKLVGLQGDLL